MLLNNITPLADPIKEKYKLMVSQDNGLSYSPEYATDNRGDPELLRLIYIAQQDMLRYYIDDSVMCQQHSEIVNFLGSAYEQRTIQDQAAMLGNKFKSQ